MTRVILKPLLIAAIVYAAIVLAFYLGQRRLLYHPSNAGLTPEGVGLTNVSVESIVTPDKERLVLWYAAAPPGAATILYLHGNDVNVSTSIREKRDGLAGVTAAPVRFGFHSRHRLSSYGM